MKLIRLTTEGLKGRDTDLKFGDVHVVSGENGEGKSTVNIGIHLLVFGQLSSPATKTTSLDSGARIPATNTGVMMLARANRIRVCGTWEGDDGALSVEREWKISRGGKVKETIELIGLGSPEMALTEKKALVRNTFAPSLDLFFPSDATVMPATQLRDRLLRAVDADFGEVSDWVPEGLPPWAGPASEAERPLDWITGARNRASARVNEDQAERRKAESILDDLEDAWQDPESPDEVQGRLQDLRAEGERARDRETLEKKIADLKSEVAAEQGALTIEQAEANIDAARTEKAVADIASVELGVRNAALVGATSALEAASTKALSLQVDDADALPIDEARATVEQAEQEWNAAIAKENTAAKAATLAQESRGPRDAWENERRQLNLAAARARGSRDDRKVAAGGHQKTDQDVADAVAHEKAASEAYNQALAARGAAEGALAAFSADCPLPECPECRIDLLPYFEQVKESARATLSAAKEAEDQASDAHLEAIAAHAEAQAGVEFAEAYQLAVDAEQALAEHEASAPLSPDASAQATLEAAQRASTETQARLVRARQVVEFAVAAEESRRLGEELAEIRSRPVAEFDREAAHKLWQAEQALERAQTSADRVDSITTELEIAEAELDELPTGRSRDAVAEQYRLVEAELAQLGELNARRSMRVEAEDAVKVSVELVERTKKVADTLQEVHQKMLKSAARIITQRFEAASGAEVALELEDARGNETCRLTVGGRQVHALSGGEMFMWLAANIMALVPAGTRWAPLVLDRFEALSKSRRTPFLSGIVEAQGQGLISQAIFTGCPDHVPAVEGVTQTVLGEDSLQEVA